MVFRKGQHVFGGGLCFYVTSRTDVVFGGNHAKRDGIIHCTSAVKLFCIIVYHKKRCLGSIMVLKSWQF